jgi:hypothetical protein
MLSTKILQVSLKARRQSKDSLRKEKEEEGKEREKRTDGGCGSSDCCRQPG